MKFFKAIIIGGIIALLAFLFNDLNIADWLRFSIILGVAVILFNIRFFNK